MIKKVFSWMLMAALGVGLSMSVASCKDDDDDNNGGSGGKTPEEQADVTQKYWDVVGQLVGIEQYTEQYQNKEFEPTIGEAETPGSLTRVVLVNDVQTAAKRFADLVGATGINENTPSYTYDDPDVGTLTYTKTNNGKSWAEVEVNIKQVPHLKKIVYRTTGDENGSFEGKAYFRFGDIVKKTNEGNDEYWICVRPAFGPEKKEDSHWVCVNYLPTKNTKTVNGSNGKNYYLPTAIGKDVENMQNFVEMLYAIFNPIKWQDNTDYHTDRTVGFNGVPIFADFQAKNVKYHNHFFWQNVQDAWSKLYIDGKLTPALGISFDNLKKMMTTGNNNGGAYMHLLYKGYSWWTATSWNLTLYEASYSCGTKNEELNMHKVAYSEPEKNVKGFTSDFDCRKMPSPLSAYNEFWDNSTDYRFFIRHATGKALNGNKTLSVKAGFDGGTGITEVYRYYAFYPSQWTDTGADPEITQANKAVATPKVGYIVGKDGKFYENVADATASSTTAEAIVVYYGTAGSVETGTQYRGLAISLKDLTDQLGGNGKETACEATYVDGNQLQTFRNTLDGIACTDKLAAACHKSHTKHELAKNCRVYFTDAEMAVFREKGFSEWFVPSCGQWVLALEAMGLSQLKWESDQYKFSGSGTSANTKIQEFFTKAGAGDYSFTDKYGMWTSTFKTDGKLWIYARYNDGHCFEEAITQAPRNTRPFIAFK